MSTDLVSWLRSQLDTDEREARSAMNRAWLPTDWAAHVLRTVAAHRALLAEHCRVDEHPDWYGKGRDWPPNGACYGCNANFNEEYAVEDVNDCPTLRALASIYEDRPGFDPSWRAE